MIILSAFRYEQSGNFRSFSCDVTHEHLPGKLFFNCQGNNLLPVDTPSCSWAAVALLFPAMVIGEDLKIEGPVSSELLFALNGDVQSLLLANQKELSRIRVIAEPCEPANNAQGTEVATAFSAGIDSFATLDIYARGKVPEGMGVTTLTIFNTGALGDVDLSKGIFQNYCERLKNYAKKFGYNWQTTDSNLDEFYSGKTCHVTRTGLLRNVACMLLFEDQYKTYLYSSSFPYREIKTSNWGVRAVEPIILPLLSTGKLQLISAGAGLSRVEKTLLVCDMDVAKDMLDVCEAYPANRAVAKYINCGKCWKCARTLITLDVFGKLEDFAETFDLEKFRSRKSKAIWKVARNAAGGKSLDREVINLMHTRKYQDMPVGLKVLCLLGFARL